MGGECVISRGAFYAWATAATIDQAMSAGLAELNQSARTELGEHCWAVSVHHCVTLLTDVAQRHPGRVAGLLGAKTTYDATTNVAVTMTGVYEAM